MGTCTALTGQKAGRKHIERPHKQHLSAFNLFTRDKYKDLIANDSDLQFDKKKVITKISAMYVMK